MSWSEMENGELLRVTEDSFGIHHNRSTTSLSAEPRWKKTRHSCAWDNKLATY
jgi:hypothetical protein